jgi:hypothetical protein
MLTGTTWATPPAEPAPIPKDAKEVVAAKMAERRAERRTARDAKNEGFAERAAKIKAEKKRQNEMNGPLRDWKSQLPESQIKG